MPRSKPKLTLNSSVSYDRRRLKSETKVFLYNTMEGPFEKLPKGVAKGLCSSSTLGHSIANRSRHGCIIAFGTAAFTYSSPQPSNWAEHGTGMERVRTLAEDLREVNEHRKGRSDGGRARIFRTHCLSRLRETAESSVDDCRDFTVALHRAERGLIAMDISACGLTLTQQIDQALEQFCTDLRRLEAEVLDLDRRRMEQLPFQRIIGARVSPHRKLVTVHIQTFSGAEFQVSCILVALST